MCKFLAEELAQNFDVKNLRKFLEPLRVSWGISLGPQKRELLKWCFLQAGALPEAKQTVPKQWWINK